MLFAVIERGHNIVHEFSRFQCIFMQWLRLFYKSSLGIVYSKKKIENLGVNFALKSAHLA